MMAAWSLKKGCADSRQGNSRLPTKNGTNWCRKRHAKPLASKKSNANPFYLKSSNLREITSPIWRLSLTYVHL